MEESASFGKDLGLLHEVVVTGRKVGADRVIYASLAHNERLFREVVDYIRYYGEPSHSRAREIMGKNFFGIEEAVKFFGVKPSIHDIAMLREIPFSEEVLQESKYSHVLIAVFPLSIREIRDRVGKKLFASDWYNEQFFANEHGEVSWQLVRKAPAPNTISNEINDQIEPIDENDEVPNARVVVYAAVEYYFTIGKHLFKDIYVRTSSVRSSNGRPIRVCVTKEEGKADYLIGVWAGSGAPWNEGLASARKSEP